MMHQAWCSIEDVPYNFSTSSIKFQGHTSWKMDDLDQIWARVQGRSQLSNPSDLLCWPWIRQNYVKSQVFCLICKRLPLGSHENCFYALWNNFGKCVDYRPPGWAIISGPFCTQNRAKNGQNFRFSSILQIKFPLDSQKFFLRSLELLSQVFWIWAPQGEETQDKGPMGPNLSRTYLEDYWTDFHGSKAIWEALGPRWARAWSLPPQGPREHEVGPKSYLGFEINWGILGWFSPLRYTLYRGHISVWETASAHQFLPTFKVTWWLMLEQIFL